MNTTQKKLDLIKRSIDSGVSRLQTAQRDSKEREDTLRLIKMLEAEKDRLKNDR